ncbi:hypothetical protein EBT31_19360, partial [bacterium]|nr:hypothetical protein [bacterium]
MWCQEFFWVREPWTVSEKIQLPPLIARAQDRTPGHVFFQKKNLISRIPNMAGGLMQLVAYGAQDIYLTGSPSITFWRIVYRRHTSFAQELISQVFNGTVGWGRRVSATVSRNGDLVYTGYLEIVLKRKVANDVDSSPYFPAEAAIESTELELGGQRIDLITSDFYRFYNELFRKDAEKDAYHRLTNFDDNTLDGVTKRFYLPLIFYWNRNPGLAIPLIALQYHELKLHIQFAQATTLARIGIDTSVDLQCELWLTYI